MMLNCALNIEKRVTTPDDEENICETTKSKQTSHEKSLEYDPYNYGKERHPTVFWGPVLHLLKIMIGTGILALPYMYKSVGYTVAIGGTVIIGFFYVHILHVLLEVEYELCKKLKVPNLTFVGVVQHSFEQGPRIFQKCTPVAKLLVYFHYVINKSISKAIYLITIGGNFKVVIDHYYGTNVNIITIISAAVLPLILLGSIRNLKFLVPLSMLTNVFNFINMILILAIPTNYDGSGDLKAGNSVTSFPNFFSVVLKTFHATSIILPLKNDMKNPERFASSFGVLNITVTTVTILSCFFGFLGYSKYGDHLQPNILFNLPPAQLLSLLTLVLYSFAISISYTLLVYVSFDIIWSNIFIDKKMKFPLATEYSLRIGLSILPYFIAVALPDFKIMLTLGGVTGILMDEVAPLVFHILLLVRIRQRTKRTYLIIFKDIGLILISLFFFTVGFINIVRSIIEFYNKL